MNMYEKLIRKREENNLRLEENADQMLVRDDSPIRIENEMDDVQSAMLCILERMGLSAGRLYGFLTISDLLDTMLDPLGIMYEYSEDISVSAKTCASYIRKTLSLKGFGTRLLCMEYPVLSYRQGCVRPCDCGIPDYGTGTCDSVCKQMGLQKLYYRAQSCFFRPFDSGSDLWHCDCGKIRHYPGEIPDSDEYQAAGQCGNGVGRDVADSLSAAFLFFGDLFREDIKKGQQLLPPYNDHPGCFHGCTLKSGFFLIHGFVSTLENILDGKIFFRVKFRHSVSDSNQTLMSVLNLNIIEMLHQVEPVLVIMSS